MPNILFSLVFAYLLTAVTCSRPSSGALQTSTRFAEEQNSTAKHVQTVEDPSGAAVFAAQTAELLRSTGADWRQRLERMPNQCIADKIMAELRTSHEAELGEAKQRCVDAAQADYKRKETMGSAQLKANQKLHGLDYPCRKSDASKTYGCAECFAEAETNHQEVLDSHAQQPDEVLQDAAVLHCCFGMQGYDDVNENVVAHVHRLCEKAVYDNADDANAERKQVWGTGCSTLNHALSMLGGGQGCSARQEALKACIKELSSPAQCNWKKNVCAARESSLEDKVCSEMHATEGLRGGKCHRVFFEVRKIYPCGER